MRASAYSACIEAAARGKVRRGMIHSAFSSAANITFPGDFVLSLNAAASPRMPNGIQLSSPRGAFPFSALRPGMPVLFGAQRLLIEALDCSLDLSCCTQWNPHVSAPHPLDMTIVERNRQELLEYITPWVFQERFVAIRPMAEYFCGRGTGLTPTGDDILAGWMAVNWLLHGHVPDLLAACQEIISVASQRTHLLSQCWLGYAAEGNVALPIKALLDALPSSEHPAFTAAVQEVLSMGATSGRDVIQGILLGLEGMPARLF